MVFTIVEGSRGMESWMELLEQATTKKVPSPGIEPGFPQPQCGVLTTVRR
jgi:hypothetical protein